MENTAIKEFLNITEIVDDVLHNLHQKDVELIKSYDFPVELIVNQHEFVDHIVKFYLLSHPQNPLLEDYNSPYEIARMVIVRVWETLTEIPTPNVA